MDEGADAFLARVPEALELCEQVGIDDVVHPSATNAFVYARGGLHPLPSGQLLGIPTDLAELETSGLVSAEGMAILRERDGQDWDPPEADVSVADLVVERLGPEVCTHLVEPLLAGINAGEAAGLSTEAVAPQIWASAQAGGSLVKAAGDMRASATESGPVFATPREGVARLPARVAERLRAEVRLNTPVRSLRVADGTIRLDDERFSGVVIATPAPVTATLLRTTAPDASAALAGIDYASVVMVTLVADAGSVDHPLDGSGFVVARNAGVDITACSWGSSKWAQWNDGDHTVFRVSVGHDADPSDWCSKTDEDLVGVVRRDLRTTMDIEFPVVGSRVTRWPRSFPQYRPGHLDLVDTITGAAAAAGPIAVAGASFRGVGIPACIRGGRAAARAVLG